MPELLHATECPCHDCWSRRLIRDAGPAVGPCSADEMEDFGHVLEENEMSQDHD